MVKLTLRTAKMHFRSNLMIMYDLAEYPRIWSSLLKPQRMGSCSFHDWQVNSKSTFQKVGLKGFVRERVKLKISTWTVTNSKVNVSVYIHEVIENSSFYKAMAISSPPPNDQVGFILRRETLISHLGILINLRHWRGWQVDVISRYYPLY